MVRVMRTFFLFFFFPMILPPSFAETSPSCSVNQSPIAKALGSCCPEKNTGVLRGDPFEILKKVSPADAQMAQEITNVIEGKTLPIFTEPEIMFMSIVGIAKRSNVYVLRPTNTIFLAGYDGEPTQTTWAWVAKDRGLGSAGEVFPKKAYPLSTRGNSSQVYPYVPGTDAPVDGIFYDWPTMKATGLMWVKEWVWTIPVSPKAWVVAARPGQAPTLKWDYGLVGLLPSPEYSVEAFFKSQSWDKDAAAIAAERFSGDLAVGLIPLLGSGLQFVDGAIQGDKFDMTLGAIGLVGDIAGGIPGLYSDVCKVRKLGAVAEKVSCVANLATNGVTLVLVTRNFLNGQGTGVQAGMGTLATLQVISSIVLLRKYPNLSTDKVTGAPTLKKLDTEKVECSVSFNTRGLGLLPEIESQPPFGRLKDAIAPTTSIPAEISPSFSTDPAVINALKSMMEGQKNELTIVISELNDTTEFFRATTAFRMTTSGGLITKKQIIPSEDLGWASSTPYTGLYDGVIMTTPDPARAKSLADNRYGFTDILLMHTSADPERVVVKFTGADLKRAVADGVIQPNIIIKADQGGNMPAYKPGSCGNDVQVNLVAHDFIIKMKDSNAVELPANYLQIWFRGKFE